MGDYHEVRDQLTHLEDKRTDLCTLTCVSQPLHNDRLLANLLHIISILNLGFSITPTVYCTQKGFRLSARSSAATAPRKLIPSSNFQLVVKVYRTESTIWFIHS